MKEVVEKVFIGSDRVLRYGIDVPAVEPVFVTCRALPAQGDTDVRVTPLPEGAHLRDLLPPDTGGEG